MKDSGIMRRVDSLGRFVLPKELRRQQKNLKKIEKST